MTWPTFRDFDLFLTEPNWVRALEDSFRRDTRVFQSLGIGAAWSNFDETLLGLKAGYLLSGKAEIQDLMDFFDDKKGRWQPFWVPTWQADLVVTAAIDPADTIITVRDVKYSDFWQPNDVTGRFLFFKFPDGSHAVRTVLDAPTSATIRLTSPIGQAVPTDQLDRLLVSFLLFCRFDQDEIEIRFLTDSAAEAALAFRTLPQEGPAATTTTTTTTSSTTTTTSTTEPPCASWGADQLTGGTVSASTEQNGYEADKACDDDETGTRWSTAVGNTSGWWKYDLGSGVTKTVEKVRIKPYPGLLKNFTIQGSNNDTDWDYLLSGQHGNDGDWEDFIFSNNTAYRYYRIYIDDIWLYPTYTIISVYEFEMYECQD